MLNPALLLRREDPLNAEVHLGRLGESWTTPNERFYIRSHFAVPAIDASTWRLRVEGLVASPLELRLAELRAMQAETMAVTLECAGNGRSLFDPPIEGEQWALGAVSNAEWRGVPLSAVLERARLDPHSTHLIFHGGDGGFDRGLSLDEAHRSQALLAYEMNGEPLPSVHGGPMRLIVPGWYAVASVKWLRSIEVAAEPFGGYFQKERYVFDESHPVSVIRVRSLITEPEDGTTVPAGKLDVRGFAWSGSGGVSRVDVSVEGGPWVQATLSAGKPHAWQAWHHTVRIEPGAAASIRSRATDSAGRVQPEHAAWNRLGYGNNSIQTVRVRGA